MTIDELIDNLTTDGDDDGIEIDLDDADKALLRERVTLDGDDLNFEDNHPKGWIEFGNLLDELREHPKMTACISRWALDVTSPNINDIDAQEHFTTMTGAAVEDSGRSTSKGKKTYSMSWTFG